MASTSSKSDVKIVSRLDVYDFDEAQDVILRSLHSLDGLVRMIQSTEPATPQLLDKVLGDLHTLIGVFSEIDPHDKERWRQAVTAFSSGTHERLGADSPVAWLPSHLVLYILHEARPRRAKAGDQAALKEWAINEAGIVQCLMTVLKAFDESNLIQKAGLVAIASLGVTAVEKAKALDPSGVGLLLKKAYAPEMWISKEEYDESGPTTYTRKVF